MPASDPLTRVQRAAGAKHRADAEYFAAILDAVEALEASPVPFAAYTRVAEAAGTSRQMVRQLVIRTRK